MTTEATKAERKHDSELLAMQRICRSLEQLDEPARGRVVAYLAGRYMPAMVRAYPINSDTDGVKLSRG